MSLLASASSRTDVSIQDSRQFCEQLTRTQARNFYYGLKLLPQQKRAAMFALYAYMRLVDDIADDQDGRDIRQRLDALDAWEESTRAALAGQRPADGQSLWPAFIDMVKRHGVPSKVFYDVIAGQRQDLDSPSFATFDDLRQYCYRVAGVVGIASIYVWGFTDNETAPGEEFCKAELLAIDRGVAFQLTNILRDLREDAGRGRIYLPKTDLDAAGISDRDISTGDGGGRFSELMAQQIQRARDFYQRSSPLEELISPDSRPTLVAMTDIYRSLLDKIAADPHRVLRQRVSLSPLSKLRIAWRAARA
jgi:15-cis-phytoene synthase